MSKKKIKKNDVSGHSRPLISNQWLGYGELDTQSKLKKKEVLEFFGGKENYIYFHNKIKRNFREIYKYIIED